MQYKDGLVALNNGATVGNNYILSPTSSGNMTAGTYYYVLSVIYPAGESVKSVEKSITLNGTTEKGVRIKWDAVPGALKYRIYRGTTSGGQNRYFETTLTTFTDIGATGTAGIPLNSSDVAQYVVGYDTKFTENVTKGAIFKRKGEDVTYEVAAVINNTLLKLNASYAGEGTLGTEYQIVRDFTENLGLTEIWAGDADWAYHLTTGVIRKIDQILWTYSGFKLTAKATENLNKNSIVNIYYQNNVLHVRKANATSKQLAHGFVDKDYQIGDDVTVILFGAMKGLSNLLPGNYYFLINNGSISNVPSDEGIIQIVGYAISPTILIFNPQPAIYVE